MISIGHIHRGSFSLCSILRMRIPGNSGSLLPDSLCALHDLLKTEEQDVRARPGGAMDHWQRTHGFRPGPSRLNHPTFFLHFVCLVVAYHQPYLWRILNLSRIFSFTFSTKKRIARSRRTCRFSAQPSKKGLTGSSSDQAFDP